MSINTPPLNSSMDHFEKGSVNPRLKNLCAIQETQVQSLCREDPLEERNGYPLQYSGVLWTEEDGGL